jgi:uncharacterized protein YwqG
LNSNDNLLKLIKALNKRDEILIGGLSIQKYNYCFDNMRKYARELINENRQNVIQNDMLIECEMVTNGIYCSEVPCISEEERKKFEKNRENWQLLLQLDTIESDGCEMMWGDCGRLYFYIKKDDLRNSNFDDCWLILQCG